MPKTLPAAPLIFGALVVALIAGVTGWMIRGRTAPTVLPDVTRNGQAADAASEPRQTPQQTDSTSRRDISSGPSPLARSALAAMAANNEKTAKVVEAGRSRLQARYQKEPIDPTWAASKQKALDEVNTSPMLEQANAKPLSFDARCRSTVCLIAANFATAEAAEDWFTLYTTLAGTEMNRAAMERSANPDGTVHMQIYGLARGNQL